MISVPVISKLELELENLSKEAYSYFDDCAIEKERTQKALQLPTALLERSRKLSRRLNSAIVKIATLVRQSPMFGNVDLETIQLAIRRCNAALGLRNFEQWGPNVIHDEDRVLGVSPAGFSEDGELDPSEAKAVITEQLDLVGRRLSVLRAQAEAEETGEATPAFLSSSMPQEMRVRPGTAFIMMMMDQDRPELEDVKQAIQEEFARFRIKAVRADEIEHSGEITNRVLEEIRTAEFLV
ncbi:MAG: hypothetical protein JNK48_01985, partial [Bryobacterales bacterium]|nr:hypothetical protein [Bryobacterales bacterium]